MGSTVYVHLMKLYIKQPWNIKYTNTIVHTVRLKLFFFYFWHVKWTWFFDLNFRKGTVIPPTPTPTLLLPFLYLLSVYSNPPRIPPVSKADFIYCKTHIEWIYVDLTIYFFLLFLLCYRFWLVPRRRFRVRKLVSLHPKYISGRK